MLATSKCGVNDTDVSGTCLSVGRLIPDYVVIVAVGAFRRNAPTTCYLVNFPHPSTNRSMSATSSSGASPVAL